MKKTVATRTLCLTLLTSAVLAGCASSVSLDQEPPATEARSLGGGGLLPTDMAALPGSPASQPVAVAPGTASLDPVTRGPRSQPDHVATDAVVAANQSSVQSTGLVRPIVYFDFDSFAIRPEFTPLIGGLAKHMQANPKSKLLIEGHADERGSREYNLALGQKRAGSVEKALRSLGVADNRLESVSWGEERPADGGRNEMAWARNRRAELKER